MGDAHDTERQEEASREQSRRLSLHGSRPPVEIEGYSIVRQLGTGAYGVVWLAREDRTGRMVAIKFYPHRRGLNWSMLSREVEKLAAVYTSHNIVRLLDVGWNSDPPYFVMEYVENGSLGNYLARGVPTVDESIRIIREVCSALVDAHGAGVLHCDLKPDNVLLDGQLHARLCDFGQSRMSHEQSPALGTLYYMAPEQADLAALPDARWDVYAVGALLYHMLTGDAPYRTESNQKRLQAAPTLEQRLTDYRTLVTESAPASGHRSVRQVDARLAEIIDRCLARDPAERFPNAQAVLDALEIRERQRARRPLLILGGVVPLILTVALIPIFVNALARNLKVTEEQITQRALESDALSARLQAAALEDELNDRLEELQTLISGDEVRRELEQLMQRPSDSVVSEMYDAATISMEARPRWMQLLDSAWERSNALYQARQRGLDTSWFLTDARGTQLWRREFSERTLGDNFSWRDYFHGRGLDFPRDNVPEDISPLSTPHVSVAYKSTTTDRQTVALSVPVRNSAGEIIGVFARTVHLGDLQARLRGQMATGDAAEVERVIALAEIRDGAQVRLLDHPSLTEEFVRSAEVNARDEELFQTLTLDADATTEIQRANNPEGSRGEVRLNVYRDPIGRINSPAAGRYSGEWLAAMAPVPQTGWMVIVQERRSGVLQPVQTMATRASQQAWLAIVVAVSVVLSVWLFVWRAIMRAGRSAESHARRPALKDSKNTRDTLKNDPRSP